MVQEWYSANEVVCICTNPETVGLGESSITASPAPERLGVSKSREVCLIVSLLLARAS